MNRAPFFSVIIPTCKRSTLLHYSVKSVLSQTFSNFELLVIDDCPDDKTISVVRLFSDSRIRYLKNARTKGASGARNVGIMNSLGEWIAFLDDDDIWLPRKLELYHNFIQSGGNRYGLIYSGYAIYDFENKNEVEIYFPNKKGWLQKELL